jgi:hypothetical protein
MLKCVYFEIHTSFRPEKVKGGHHQVYLDTYCGLALILGLTLQKWNERM